jgi:hypothetical protein
MAGSAGAKEYDRAALEAAKTWLSLTDGSDYARAWDDAAPYLQGAVTRDAFSQAVAGARDPLGDVESRKLSSATQTKSLPGAPDGDYLVMQFKTSFKNKRAAVETVTVMRVGKSWQVAGYFIK